MATITKKKILTQPQFGGTPYGNLTTLPFNVTSTSTGAIADSDSTAAVTAADKIRVGVLPAGMKLIDALMIVSNAFTATATAKVGFEYVDGVDDTAVPQDADYFAAALAVNALGRTRANNTAVAPVTLPKDAYLVIDWDVASNAEAGVLDIFVEGILNGPP
ncbi:hypothetical protein [Polaromonas sp.]|uniref:hypothetical protein n=1 Tax=Polaromonas sp. TaxID=1869339 RepID=UPI0032670238